MQETKTRVFLLDELRGLSIILMVIYHTVFDLIYVFDVDFPLFTQTYAVEEFNAIVSMEPANNVFRVPVESVVMDEVDTDINGISNDTVEEEIETAPAESPVPEVAEALPSEENVYRY